MNTNEQAQNRFPPFIPLPPSSSPTRRHPDVPVSRIRGPYRWALRHEYLSQPKTPSWKCEENIEEFGREAEISPSTKTSNESFPLRRTDF